MKCQHCGSDDIVAIQGQNYCLNCGEPVTATITALVVPAAEVAVVSAPKAAAGLIVKAPKTPAAKLPKRRPRIAGAVMAKPLAHKPKTKALARKSVVKKTITSAATKPKTSDLTRITQPSQALRARPQRSANAPSRPHPFRFSIAASALLGSLVAVVAAASMWFQLDAGLALYVIGVSAVAAFGLMALAQAALYYGLARSLDGRPTPRALWWAAARGGFMDVLNVRIMSLISITILVGLALAGWWLGGHSELSQSVVTGTLMLANVLLGWAALGVYIAERMAMPAVVVGGLTATAALRIGWRLYVQAGGHLLVTAFEALIGRLLVLIVLISVALVALKQFSSIASGGLAIMGISLALGLFCFAVAMVILELDVTLWLRQYRHWAARLAPAERLQLLTGRTSARSQS